jgi:hypothetical protein
MKNPIAEVISNHLKSGRLCNAGEFSVSGTLAPRRVRKERTTLARDHDATFHLRQLLWATRFLKTGTRFAIFRYAPGVFLARLARVEVDAMSPCSKIELCKFGRRNHWRHCYSPTQKRSRRIRMSHEKFQSCIDACLDCAQACEQCADACLGEKDVAKMAECIRTDRDCASMCWTTATLMNRNSQFSAQACELLAQFCEACAQECEKHDMQHCQDCANSCRKCAAECREMAGVRA